MTYTKNSRLICPPDFYDVVYEINPWMDVNKRPDKNLAQEQWHNYEKKLLEIGLDLHYLEPQSSVPDLVFTANHGLVKNNKVVLAKMNNVEREGEEKIFTKWFKDNGFETYQVQLGSFEGEGDAFIVNNKLFFGYGFRTDKAVAEEIKDLLSLEEIIYCRLLDPYYYHLDTCFAPLNENQALVYPPAIDADDLSQLRKHLDLIEVEPDEAPNFACNIVVSGNKLVIPASCSKTAQHLESLGFETYSTPLTQFIKAGGAAKCLCVRLDN